MNHSREACAFLHEFCDLEELKYFETWCVVFYYLISGMFQISRASPLHLCSEFQVSMSLHFPHYLISCPAGVSVLHFEYVGMVNVTS